MSDVTAPVPAEAGKSLRSVTERKALRHTSSSMRFLGLRLLLLAGLASATTGICAADQLLPDRVGWYRKSGSRAAPSSDPALFQELGSTRSESATYRGAGRQQTITAYQVRDTTG